LIITAIIYRTKGDLEIQPEEAPVLRDSKRSGLQDFGLSFAYTPNTLSSGWHPRESKGLEYYVNWRVFEHKKASQI